ncbi:MAG: rRNA maturation RNase YbeY [Elusimicrobiota bacterium]|nr:rRNA maturation RNase YbeY [Endomicrobiia bacterium]MDW8165021.1 rRNA maturation RNase YbeY [Elusimicrobiota bacterium]
MINLIYKTNLRIINPEKLKKYIKKFINILFNKKLKNKLQFNFVFLNNNEIRKFNKKYLNKNRFTDILCFKYDETSCDFLISLEQIKKNAKVFKNKPSKELLLVIAHGLLHFKGMNDDTEYERKKMELLGNEIILKVLSEKL